MKLNKLFLALAAASTLMSSSVWAEELKIHVIAKGFQHQYWKAVKFGTDQAAQDFKVDIEFQGPDTESNIAQQVEYLNIAISSLPDAICLAALNTEAMMGSLEMAMNKNIPIIGFDSGVPDAPDGAIKANAATDNFAAGKLAAEQLYKMIKDKIAKAQSPIRIGVIVQDATSQANVERAKGFITGISELVGKDKVSIEGNERFENVVANAKVIFDVGIPTEVNTELGTAIAKSVIEKSDTIAIYGANEFATNCIIFANQGLNKLGSDKILAIGFDAGSHILDAIQSGVLVGAVTQNPVKIGYEAVRLAVDTVKGKPVTDVDTGALWYNKENMDKPEIAACLYR